MKFKQILAGVLACLLTWSGMGVLPAAAEGDGIVFDGEHAQYLQNGVAMTGKFGVTPEILIGDTDGNAVTDATDAALLLSAAAEAGSMGTDVGEALLARSGGSFTTAAEAMAHGDCNGDGTADATDAAVLLSHVAEIGANKNPNPLGYTMYYADESGYLQKGWITAGAETYYAGEDYALHMGWLTADGNRYYFDRNGIMLCSGVALVGRNYYYFQEDGALLCSSWQDTQEGRYYFGEDGAALVGFRTLDSKYYYFSTAGVMQKGWHTLYGNRYYFGEDGAAVTGWQTIDGSRYYFQGTGIMQTGFRKLNDLKYYFGTDGVMRTGWVTVDGSVYYFGETGAAATGWQTIDGSRYYFNAAGVMKTGMITVDGQRYYMNENGVMQTGLVRYNDNLYYFGTDGAAVTGWQELEGNTYYFRANYTAVKGFGVIGGKKYYFLPSDSTLMRSATHNGYTTNADGVVIKHILDVEYISQAGYPTGCESASAVMLLHAAGYSTTIADFIDSALNIGSLYYSGGILYGPHPDDAFIGNPRLSSGYGCYAPVIVNALNKILTGGDTAVNLTGTSLSDLLTNYVDRGTPVAVWATINMVESTPGTQWVIPETGKTFTWKRSEHCLVLVGYDENYYYFNDPYNNNGLKAYDKATVEARFAYMGSQSVVIAQGVD